MLSVFLKKIENKHHRKFDISPKTTYIYLTMSQQPVTITNDNTKSPISYDNIPAIELESMRLQLNKLISSFKNLQQQLILPSVSLPKNNSPTISWAKLSERVEASINHLNKLQKNIIQFDSFNVYPNVGKFPVNEEDLINVLLRKKNLPEIDNLYADLLKIGEEKIKEYKETNNLSDIDDEEVIKKYFTENDLLISKNLKLLKQTKKQLFGNKDKLDNDFMDVDDKIDLRTYTISSEMIPFDIESVYKYMYSGVKKEEENKQPDVVML